MKRVSGKNDEFEYDDALKKVNLVERNPNPNGVPLLSVARVGKHESNDIVVLATEIKNADNAIKNSACAKLSLILDQIRFLQSQADKILKETELSGSLHHVACNFRKVPGNIYHLYERESGQKYFSMLAPEEWGSQFTHKYIGCFRLESDSSWTPINNINEMNEKREWCEKILNASAANRVKNILSIEQIIDVSEGDT